MYIYKNKGFICNIIIPILFGAIFYYVFAPETIFVQYVDKMLGLNLHIKVSDKDNIVYQIIRYYVLDMLWSYSLVITLVYVLGSNAASISRSFMTAMMCVIVMELLQCIPSISGTFDWYDILVELLASLIAVFVINKFLREKENEK